MINLKDLIKNREDFLNGFKNKGYDLKLEVDQVISFHQKYLELLQKEETSRYRLNKITEKIKQDLSDKKLKKQAATISQQIKNKTIKRKALLAKIDAILLTFPNVADQTVPIGLDETKNQIISKHLEKIKKPAHNKPHWDILKEKHLILEQEATALSGRRQIIFTEKAALFLRALESFMIEEHINAGYNFFELPVIVNQSALLNTGHLPKFENDLFKLNNDQYLIPTAEVTLVNLVADKILNYQDLPLKFVAFSNCFRNENVAAGKDSRGIIRLYQFRKVELVKIGNPSQINEDFAEILEEAAKILEKLQIPYQIVELCTGDLSFGSKRTIDFEIWMPGINTYREVSSASIMGDFQARRMHARFIDQNNNKVLPFTYNASGLAIERVFAAILENYLDPTGDIVIPEVLRKFLPFHKI